MNTQKNIGNAINFTIDSLAIAAVLLLLAVALFGTGCATIIDGQSQSFTVDTKNDANQNATECTLRNSQGAWETDGRQSLQIERDYDDLIIECENDTQEGETTVVSSTSGGFMALNFFVWDLCTISCLIDHSTVALYEYPKLVRVPMRAKQMVATDE